MFDPGLRCQLASATSVALPFILNGSYISDVAADMADVMLSILAGPVSRSRCSRGPQCWCAGPGVQADMNRSMATERRGEEEPPRRPQQWHYSKVHEDYWQVILGTSKILNHTVGKATRMVYQSVRLR